MTPREMAREQTASIRKPFSLQELVLHGKPNFAAAIFFALIASLHVYIAIHSLEIAHSSVANWEGLISALLGGCFLIVALTCALAQSEISIHPKTRMIHLRTGLHRFATHRYVPFTSVRAIRVTLWQSVWGPQSRLEILCHSEEIPCPPTSIPRQQALYLALVMNARLIKISDDRSGNTGNPPVCERSNSSRW